MIEQITVRNFILVESLSLEFTAGFNVLTGETGAGKSILVGALSVLLGGKGGGDLVREGADEASVAGEFVVDQHQACQSWLSDHGITPEDGRVLIRRTLRTTGRGTIHIAATPVTRSELEEFTGLMLDLHSQHEHQSLFSEPHHRRILDRVGGFEDDVETFHTGFLRLTELQERFREIQERSEARVREMEMLRFAVDEIDDADVKPGEMEAFEAERDRMAQFERLAEHIGTVSKTLDGSEYAVLPLLKHARQEFAASARIDATLEADRARIESVYFELEDIVQNLSNYQDALVFDPTRLEEIEDRLTVLRRLQRKYGESETAVLDHRDAAAAQLGELAGLDEDREKLSGEIAELEQEITRSAKELHQQRRNAADTLRERIETVLSDLAMGQAKFKIEIESRTNDQGRLVCGPYGADRVRFLIGTNVGVDPQPLIRVASGGELSRVMLAIKTIIAAVDDVRSLIFDEIDTGVGGQVAVAIASHMRKLADQSQVISITHLATIAVRADNHIVVEKEAVSNTTRISTRRVTGDDRIKEVARMLAGEQEEVTGMEHARALLDRYQRVTNGQD